MNYDIKNLTELLAHYKGLFVDFLPKLFIALLLVIAFLLVAKWMRRWVLKLTLKLSRGRMNIASIAAAFTYFVVLVIGLVIVLEFMGLQQMVTKVLAGAGVLGIIAGFAFKDIASNLFAGLLLKWQDPFGRGDWIQIGSTYGLVLEIGWILTRVHSITGQEIFIPNQTIYNSSFTNYTTFKRRRIILESGVSYGDDLDKVKAVALDEVMKIDQVLKDEEIDFFFTSIGGSSYNFQLRFWIEFHRNHDYLTAMDEVIRRIKKRFEVEGISIPYNVTTLDFGVKGGVNLYDKPIKVQDDRP